MIDYMFAHTELVLRDTPVCLKRRLQLIICLAISQVYARAVNGVPTGSSCSTIVCRMKICFLAAPWRNQPLTKYARLLSEARSGILSGVYFADGSVANYLNDAWVAKTGNRESDEALDFCNEVERRNFGFGY